MSAEKPRFALVVSRFNEEVTSGLLRGALQYLYSREITPSEDDIYNVPGAFEIPLIAKKLAQTGKYSGVICLGCVIKGETAHFEYISLAATYGITQSMLDCGVPISFGVLTTYDTEQALARSLDDAQNKGREAASACFEAHQVLNRISTLSC